MNESVTRTEAVPMGRPPKEPTEILGLRLPVAQVERLDKLLADKRFKGQRATFGIRNRTDLIRFILFNGIEMVEREIKRVNDGRKGHSR